MVIELDSDLFLDNNNLKDINFLISLFSDGRRYFYFCDINKIKETELFNQLLPIDKELIKENFNSIINQSKEINHVVTIKASPQSFDLNEAKRFFNQPVSIILENSLNDGYFVDAIFRNFTKKGKLIKRHKENGWIKYDNAGGCENIENLIHGLMRSFDALPKDNKHYLRCIVIIDSDKSFETELVNATRQKLLQFLKEHNIEYHVLEKREMENYMPDEVIDSIPEIDQYLQIYLKLTAKQKDYFDLEKGFNGKNLGNYSQEVQVLYNGLTDSELGILRKGMNMEKYKKGENFKSEFPKLFESAKVNQENLSARTAHQSGDPDELKTILDKITKLL